MVAWFHRLRQFLAPGSLVRKIESELELVRAPSWLATLFRPRHQWDQVLDSPAWGERVPVWVAPAIPARRSLRQKARGVTATIQEWSYLRSRAQTLAWVAVVKDRLQCHRAEAISPAWEAPVVPQASVTATARAAAWPEKAQALEELERRTEPTPGPAAVSPLLPAPVVPALRPPDLPLLPEWMFAAAAPSSICPASVPMAAALPICPDDLL